MSKIVIFGGSGFVGTYLRVLLDNRGMSYVSPSMQEIDLAQTTLATYNAIDEIVDDGDSIIMLAGYTNEYGHPPRLTAENIAMAANLLWGIFGKNISHFVYLSSDSVYGNVTEAPFWEVIDEFTPISPNSLYGFMHATREQFFREHFSSDKLTILRPCVIYGDGDTHNAYGINQFIKDAKEKGEITLFGNGEEYRSSIYVEDMAAIIAKAIEEKISGRFNVNCGVSMTFREIAEFIKQNIEKNIVINSKPRTIPIYHRYFNNTSLVENFFAPRNTEIGIKGILGIL
jgi:UDP-glucose 4-epimerase